MVEGMTKLVEGESDRGGGQSKRQGETGRGIDGRGRKRERERERD